MTRLRIYLLLTFLALVPSVLAQGIGTDFPREETLIVHNPENQNRVPGNFNIWGGSAEGWSTGLHQLMFDTLWYIDPDAGIDGPTYNSLASGPPVYNDDFTEMTVPLREGIYWSDGVEFTAADVVYTVELQRDTPGMLWSSAFSEQVETVEALDDYTVKFTLNAPNSRFQSLFSVRWNAAWIMPKHVFEKVEDPLQYDFNPPVGLGPYKMHSYDPDGFWYAWERRDDWQRTSVAEFGEPAPRYVIYRAGIPTDRRLIEMRNGDLDMIHDLTPEGVFSIVEEDETARGWFDGFPYAHPDPTLPSIMFNLQNEKFEDKRVRWALALMLDARAMSMASYRGAATMSAIAIPPTGTHPDDYHIPMQEWLTNYTIEAGGKTFQPYDPNLTLQVAESIRGQFEGIPTAEDEVRRSFGYGWWAQNLEAATLLLQDAGFTQQGNDWYMPNGERFSIKLNYAAEGVFSRLGAMIAQNWQQAGVEVTSNTAPTQGQEMEIGDFDAALGWSVETWGGHPDLSFFLDSWHSQFLAEPGQVQPARNWQRWSNPELDQIIEEIRSIDFNDPRGVELGQEFVKLAVDEMPLIPLMSFNVFSVVSERYWTGFPTAENPYANPVTNWANGRYIMNMIKPVAP